MKYYIIAGIVIVVLTFLFVYLNSPSSKGRKGEKRLAIQLKMNKQLKNGGKELRNIYLTNKNGDTSEIDILYITRKGILVFENKNYAGYIFGDEHNKTWTVSLYAGKTDSGYSKTEKHQFYNPVWQNNTHIKNLKLTLNKDLHFFSIITFSNKSKLKSITCNSPNVHVCNHAKLPKIIREIFRTNADILSDEQIEGIYNMLLPFAKTDKKTQKAHIENIQNKFNSTEICPACGGKLVLRTARNGENAGKQFYGCEYYPNCKYTRNL